MTLKKEREPLVSGITRSPKITEKSRSFESVDKYTNYGIVIPLNFEIVLINGMEAVSK
jgi:hypothetical protein